MVTELRIDVDLKALCPKWCKVYYAMDRTILVAKYLVFLDVVFGVERLEVYGTKNGLHLYVGIGEDLEPWTVLLVQQAVDDPFRIMFNTLRIMGRLRGTFNLLFKRKYRVVFEGGRIVEREVVHTERRLRLLERWFWRYIKRARERRGWLERYIQCEGVFRE